jgi:N-acetyl-anhydromuramyl-L-alanine amidase AmpD
VLWSDTNGYNAYRLHRHFETAGTAAPDANSSEPAEAVQRRYDPRHGDLTAPELARIRTNGWDLPTLQRCVDQFVIHYDVAGTSRQCFYILHDRRFLSVHFMLDLDGTIYQTLDLQERARHASGANDRSVGVEIANIGAYPTNETSTLEQWYERDTNGQTRVTLPERFGDGGLLTTNFIARPARADAITNTIHGRTLVQYDFTPEQYAALAHLTAALCRALPQIQCDAPRDADGKVLAEKVPDEDLEKFRGLVGHYHLTTNKTDPGPAFDWEKLLGEAQRLMNETNSASGQSP